MADVVPLCCIGRCYAFGRCCCHLMVWQMVSHKGRYYNLFTEQSGSCYCHCNDMWQMVSHSIACYNLVLIKWQMLLPRWQMEWPPEGRFYCAIGRCCCYGGRWNSHLRVCFYFDLSSEVLNRTSSQMWGRWYLPMYLFRDGLLTLIYNASLIVLVRFWSSLPTILNIHHSSWSHNKI